MKLSLLILLLFVLSSKSQGQSRGFDSIALKRENDSLKTLILNFKKGHSQSDTLLVKIDKLSETFKANNSSWLDKFLPSLIALFTVLISSTVAYLIGMKNARVQKENAKDQIQTQKENAEDQIQSQQAIAIENLRMAKEQLEQNTKNTLTQVRANNISKARIEWIQNLRPLLSNFLANISKVASIHDDIITAQNKNDSNKVVQLSDRSLELLNSMLSDNNQISLFLNLDNASHKELRDSINDFFESVSVKSKQLKGDTSEIEQTVIVNARRVLKEAWEQAKTDATV